MSRMVGSDEFVNYRIRPAKSIERKMFLESVRRLSSFHDIKDYRYVGFGSAFFNDFTLFHKQLGLRKMISIEGNVKDEKRYEFNLPYAAVDLWMGMSTDLLPKVPWDSPVIVWLDYDYRLDIKILEDVYFVARHAPWGSFLFVTVDAEPLEHLTDRAAEMVELWGGRRSTAYYRRRPLGKWGTAREFRRRIHSEIQEAVGDRPKSKGRTRYQQVLHFDYSDGHHHMLSVGGVICGDDAKQKRALAVADLSTKRFPFCRPGDAPYLLEVPSLTPKEVRALEVLLPLVKGGTLDSVPVPGSLVVHYPDFYRYYPTFSEVEI